MRLSNKSWGMWAAALMLTSASILSSCQKSPGYGRRTASSPGKKSATTGASFNFDEKDTTQFFVSKNAHTGFAKNIDMIYT